MRTVKKPTEDAGTVFRVCVDGYSYAPTKELKDRLLAVQPAIEEAAVDYDAAALSAALHTIPQADTVTSGGVTVTRNEMARLYDDKLAKLRASGRSYYDALKARAVRGICPLCGQRTVTTLDHHLPKKKFPALAVTPLNLIPSCTDCNIGKRTDCPATAADQTFHPYYDDFTNEPWLHAEVVETDPPAVRFSVRAPSGWDILRVQRAESHLDVFGLKDLYSTHAASELVNIHGSLRAEFERAGSAGVHEFLRETAASREAAHLNSWETATYKGLDRSEWFCSTGFSLIK